MGLEDAVQGVACFEMLSSLLLLSVLKKRINKWPSEPQLVEPMLVFSS